MDSRIELEARWAKRSVPSNTIKTILEILDRNLSSGWGGDTEGGGIVEVSLGYLGLPYLRTEELDEDTVDCSTLTSQSHWLGGLIGIPFTSEGQRMANNAREVNLNNLAPGDVLVKYPSLSSAPGGRFNHVGLVLGWDFSGRLWVIESSESKDGCVITLLSDFDPKGPSKRFSVDPKRRFVREESQVALGMAQHVPKLGRLGAKQYLKGGGDRRVHAGLDIYCPVGTKIFAPIGGSIKSEELPEEDSQAVVIESDELRIVLGHLGDVQVKYAGEVSKGAYMGVLVRPSLASKIIYHEPESHLHFEVHRRDASSGSWKPMNGLYLAKECEIELPLYYPGANSK